MKQKVLSVIKVIDDKVNIKKFLKFGITGVMNTAIDWGIYTLCNEVFRIPAAWLSQFFATAIAMANSFIINKLWTFKKTKGFEFGELRRFIFVNAVSMGLSMLSIYILSDIFGVNKYLAKIPVAFVTIVINYFGNKLFVFREKEI